MDILFVVFIAYLCIFFILWVSYQLSLSTLFLNRFLITFAKRQICLCCLLGVKRAINFVKRNYGDHFTYKDFAPMFQAEKFDPDAWAHLFSKSGARLVHSLIIFCQMRQFLGFCFQIVNYPHVVHKRW